MFRYSLNQQALGENLLYVSGEFEPNGALAINNALNVSGRGQGPLAGFTVARISLGLYEITLSEPVVALISASFTLLNGSNNALGGLEGVNVAGPNTATTGMQSGTLGRGFRVRAKDATGAPADIVQAAGRKIQFTGVFKTKTF